MRAFGAPLDCLGQEDLSRPGTVFRIGVAPVCIDVLTAIDGVDFDEAWRDRLNTRFADKPVLSLAHVIRKKRAAGRPQDLADLDWLEKSGRKK